MKTNLLCTLTAAVLTAASAVAQSSTTLKANVPFDFIVNNRTLPPGQYTVDSRVAFGALMIRSADGKGAAIALARPLYSTLARNEGSLVFHRYGYAHFLSQVWSSGNNGRQLPTTGRERELAARLSAPANTTIAAVR